MLSYTRSLNNVKQKNENIEINLSPFVKQKENKIIRYYALAIINKGDNIKYCLNLFYFIYKYVFLSISIFFIKMYIQNRNDETYGNFLGSNLIIFCSE